MRHLITAAVVITAMGCVGGRTPTSSSPEPAVVVQGRPDLQAESEAQWAATASCVGAKLDSIHSFPVVVMPDWFMCGDVKAVGCMEFKRIRATEFYQGRRYYEGVLGHEFVHLALWKARGSSDINHSGPEWGRCDQQATAVGADIYNHSRAEEVWE